MEKITVLITGGAGYLGSVLTQHLLRRGYEVTVLDNLMYKQTSLLHLFSESGFTFIKGDVRDVVQLQKLVQSHDIIIPLAAIVGMPACDADKELATQINFCQIQNIADWLRVDQKLILPNTNSQYGSSDTIITEESPFKPLSHYAQTKCDSEKYMLDRDSGVSLRLATVFGVSPRMRQDLLVNDFVYRAIYDGFLVLFESHFKRNYIHVLDIAKTFEFIIDHYPDCVGKAFNVGLSSMNLSKLELATKIKEFVPELVIVENNFKEDVDQRNYIVSNEKLEKLGWYPQHDLNDGIPQLINAYTMVKPRTDREFTNL